MSLGKLLATGRSLVGGAPDEGRYNISNANRLPKFGSVKNPFAPSATSEARVVTSGTESADGLGSVGMGQPLTPALNPAIGTPTSVGSALESFEPMPDKSGVPAGRFREGEKTPSEFVEQVERPVGGDHSADRLEACPTNTRPDSQAVDERIAEFVRQSESNFREAPEEFASAVERVTLCAPSFDNPGSGANGLPRPAKLRSVSIAVVSLLKNVWRVSKAVIVAAWAAVRRFKWRASLQFCRSMAGALWTLIRRAGPLARAAWDQVKFVFVKLAGLFRKRGQQEPKQVFPRFGKPAVQAELSLDSIKVVRNNLEESDLEIVTSETRTGTQVAPTTPVALPKRGPVPAALKKMTGVILKR